MGRPNIVHRYRMLPSETMYIHRIVIDANCINAKGALEAMNKIEAYHEAGVIELLITSTLEVEFSNAPLQNEKAQKYMSIGGAVVFFSGTMHSSQGAVPQKSKFDKYFKEIFPNEQSEKSRVRSLRDCLHIDQAVLNNCDYFITQEKKLISAGNNIDNLKREIKIVEPEQCLLELQKYFKRNHRTSEPNQLKTILFSGGPVILGSNSSLNLEVKDPSNGERLLCYYVKDNNLIIECAINDDEGTPNIIIKRGKPIEILVKDVFITTLGVGPLVVGERNVNQVYIGTDDVVYLSVRAISSGRAVFDRVKLCSRDGKKSLVVEHESLLLQGLEMTTEK